MVVAVVLTSALGQLAVGERARRLADELLLVGQVEVHDRDTILAMGNAFTVVFGGLLAFFVITVLLLGLFSKRSARDYLDWKPTRSPEVELQNEIDDVAR